MGVFSVGAWWLYWCEKYRENNEKGLINEKFKNTYRDFTKRAFKKEKESKKIQQVRHKERGSSSPFSFFNESPTLLCKVSSGRGNGFLVTHGRNGLLFER
jgi:hypothetical protein